MQSEGLYSHPVSSFETIQTHISWVLLTGPFAYKIKKPVSFDFLDFSTLRKRKHFCELEVQLNRRLCPDLYRDVISIGGTYENPIIQAGDPIEYAVKMKQFDQEKLLSNLVTSEEIPSETIDELAKTVSEFHQTVDDEPPDASYGSRSTIKENMIENFEAIAVARLSADHTETFRTVKDWSHHEFERLGDIFERRRRNGFVRECHGDMHLNNIVLDKPDLLVFDCIEFNESLRWIDVIDEIAFLTMDMIKQNSKSLANRFTNRYVNLTGDFEGLRLLPFYRVYRAMVRCKVNFLQQSDSGRNKPHRNGDFKDYLQLTEKLTRQKNPVLLITHGLPGAGKTTLTQNVLEKIGAIRVRSDVERKRLAGLDLTGSSSPKKPEDLYSRTMTNKTYSELRKHAKSILRAGFPVIIDATFLKKKFRKQCKKLAEQFDVPFRILDFRIPLNVLEQRLQKRDTSQSLSDADRSVLNLQKQKREPLDKVERKMSMTINQNQRSLRNGQLNELNSLIK